MKRLEAPKSLIGWLTWAAWSLVGVVAGRVAWVLIGLNIETYAQANKLDRLWAARMVDPFTAGLGPWLLSGMLAVGFLLGHYLDRWIAKRRPSEIATRAVFEAQIIPSTGPAEIGSENIYSWGSFSMTLQAHEADGKRTRIPFQVWVICLWFDRPIGGYTVDVVAMAGEAPMHDVRHMSPRGLLIAFDCQNQASTVRITCNVRQAR